MMAWQNWYLLIPLSPILAIICLAIFLYEYVVQNDQERIERPGIGNQVFDVALMLISFTFTLPAMITDFLGPVGTLVRTLLTLPFSILLSLWWVLEQYVWNHLFQRIVPFIYVKWNSSAYQPLQEAQIRVIELLPGSPRDNIRIRLFAISLDEEIFEALSYSWGGHLMLRRVIQANDRSFFVTDTVFRALRELRYSARPRKLWIDAVSINQGNIPERRSQVDMMGDIYRRAAQVIVWLGKAPDPLTSAFDYIPRLMVARPDEFDNLYDESSGWQESVRTILRSRWWSRVWIVPEVALAPKVVIRSGPNEISWEVLASFLAYPRAVKKLSVEPRIINFVKAITELRKPHPDPPLGQLHFALQFRDRVASDPRDKLYAFRGLLQNPQMSNTLHSDYHKHTYRVFAEFAASHLCNGGDLSLMTLAESHRRYQGISSWVVDWEKMTDPKWVDLDPMSPKPLGPSFSHLFWAGSCCPTYLGSPILGARKYSADAGLPASCWVGTDDTYLKPESWTSLHLEGWQEDTIAMVGGVGPAIVPNFQHFQQSLLPDWEKLAGGPWTHYTDAKCIAFNRTLLADTWAQNPPTDWPDRSKDGEPLASGYARVFRQDSNVLKDQSTDVTTLSTKLRLDLSHKRQFFITQKGRFGLGPQKCSKGDLVCVLLGSRVPFIFRRGINRSHIFLGQAYVDGIMDYKGDLNKDIRDGKVKTEEFWVT